MTSGPPLYLVSACGSAEEFVAAFRRYADRTGLFVPSASPLPAGRRGRIAVTLKDGGVMIEGEAEILQSSNKPTVLYGRPGMTVKFVEPDELSKIILGELEKARLAMKVPAPSVPPRPAKDFPAEPRAVPPPPGGRIDATNALAECVVIGDPSMLRETASAPRGIADSGSGKAKFSVPSIPGAPGSRAKTPSIPPESGRAKTPSIPPESARTKTPSIPPPPESGRAKTPSIPPAIPPPAISSRMTSIGFPAIDKLPANPANPPKMVSADNPLLGTLSGTQAPANPTKETKAENPLLQTQHGVGPAAPAKPASKPDSGPVVGRASTIMGAPNATGAPVAPAPSVGSGRVSAKPPEPVVSRVITDDDATSIGEAPVKKITDPMPTTAPVKTGEMAAAAPAPAAAAAPAAAPAPPKIDPSKSKPTYKATSIGFPAIRTPFETQPVGVVPPPTPNTNTPGEPAPPVVGKSKPPLPQRGKNPTTPPLTPRHPTPHAPLPIVRLPMKPQPLTDVEEEKTDLSGIPTEGDKPGLPPEQPVEQIDPLGNTHVAQLSARSGGMRASEIMAAIPTEDWTMTPDASGPTVLPTSGPTPADAGANAPADVNEPTPAPGMPPKGPPTGNWTIALDPETGWQEPQKLAPTPVAPPAPAPAPKEKPKSGNPDIAVASQQAFTAVEWEDKPTGIGEAKIEIDPTLMEPLKPMPNLDDEDVAPLPGRPPTNADRVGSTTGRAAVIPPPLAPMPLGPSSRSIPAAAMMNHPSQGTAGMSAAMPAAPMGPPTDFSNFAFPQPPAGLHDIGASGSVASVNPAAASKKRTIIIAAGAAFAVIVGFVLVLMLAGGKHDKKTKSHAAGGGSAIAQTTPADAAAIVPMHEGSAGSAEEDGSAGSVGSAGSAQVAIVDPPVGKDAGTATPPPPTDGTCHVAVSSVPTGADVYMNKAKVGTTPGTFDLPCGAEATLILKKSHFLATDRTVTPSPDKDNKVVIKLGKTMFSLKVKSTPAGATIMAAGKNAGVTPATIKLPGFESSTITLTKPGFSADTQKVTPKTNGQAHHVVLKKKGH